MAAEISSSSRILSCPSMAKTCRATRDVLSVGVVSDVSTVGALQRRNAGVVIDGDDPHRHCCQAHDVGVPQGVDRDFRWVYEPTPRLCLSCHALASLL